MIHGRCSEAPSPLSPMLLLVPTLRTVARLMLLLACACVLPVTLGCGGGTVIVNPTPTGLHTFTTLEGPPITGSQLYDFDYHLSATDVFRVDGPLTVKATLLLPVEGAVQPMVQGYLIRAKWPRDPAIYVERGNLFMLAQGTTKWESNKWTYVTNGRVHSWSSVHGYYYIVAGGQECQWSLDVLE